MLAASFKQSSVPVRGRGMFRMSKDFVEFLLLPEEFLPVYVRSTKDIYEHRSLLKQLLLGDYALNYLLDIIVKAVEDGARFRMLDCLKVVKAILKNNPLGLELDSRTVGKLFYLYKTFIFHKNEKIQACANLLVRFQCLNDDGVSWLVSNWNRSEHSLNRLLRYPKKHPLITQWAKGIYQQGQLRDRQAEIAALLIDESIPPFVTEDEDTIVWAIYHSRVSDEIKQRLLMERFSVESLDSLWKVSVRLRYSAVIEFMRAKVREQSKGAANTALQPTRVPLRSTRAAERDR